MFRVFRAMTLLILSTAYVKTQQPISYIYGTTPSQYSAFNDDPQWRRYNVQYAKAPIGTGYYKAPNTQLSAQQFVSPSLPTTPIRTVASPYNTNVHYGPYNPATALQYVNQIPQQKPRHQTQKFDQLRRAAPQIVQQQRNEGNFYRQMPATNATTAVTVTALSQRKHEVHTQKPKFVANTAGYAVFEHKVLHVTTPSTQVDARDYRKRRSFPSEKRTERTSSQAATRLESKNGMKLTHAYNLINGTRVRGLSSKTAIKNDKAPTQQQERHFHDIFMHYADPQNVAYGHVEDQPLRFAKRFESSNKGNRYRGEVTWADAKTGGYGSQQWDLVQGKV